MSRGFLPADEPTRALVVANAATHDSSVVILDSRTGERRCSQRLPSQSDRAGPTVSGGTGILALANGLILARPLTQWLTCTVQF